MFICNFTQKKFQIDMQILQQPGHIVVEIPKLSDSKYNNVRVKLC